MLNSRSLYKIQNKEVLFKRVHFPMVLVCRQIIEETLIKRSYRISDIFFAIQRKDAYFLFSLFGPT